MSANSRSVVVLAVGMALGLGLSLTSTVWADHDKQAPAAAPGGVSPEYMQLLTEVLERVRTEYVDEIDDKRLVESAIHGILENLDPHSRYLDPTQYADIRISTTGKYSGVGLDVSLEDGKVKVVSPLDGAPADRAGILPGDVVVSVDNMPVSGNNIEETVERMRGTAGTQVEVAVLRDGRTEPLQFELTRADIQVKTVRSTSLGQGYAYVKLTGFSDTTAADLEQAAMGLMDGARGPLKGLVLDLRNNPGGVLDAAVDVADLFLDKGLIVRGEGRVRDATFAQYASPGDLLENVPLVVLVNAGSASASEIVAGALKDRNRARLVGVRTYGKGSVQTVMPLGEGRAIKLTTSLYLTPSGRSINGIGIDPDEVVPSADPKRLFAGAGGPDAAAQDNQVAEALRLLGYRPTPKVPVPTQAAVRAPAAR
ncbi:MAG TPA: S41 family peptidase [Gammaproteobacteria bacterium]|nr:S41 family peptidase [Gammaproteobacteria bacterium]